MENNNKTIYYKPLPPKPAVLLILESRKKVRVVPLSGDMTMGRASNDVRNDIPLNSGIASRNHGQFLTMDGEYYYKDNNSLNGTYYNGYKLQPYNERGTRAVKLKDGDVLRIDRVHLDAPHSDAVVIIFSTSFSPDEKWYRFPFQNRKVIPIGRNNTSGIALSDFMVSREHAALVNMGDKWKVVDNHSTNGVAVNKKSVAGEQILAPFDVIRIANTTLIYMGNEVIFNQAAGSVSAAAPPRSSGSMMGGTGSSMGSTFGTGSMPPQPQPQPNRFDYNRRSVIMNINIQDVRVRKHGSFSKVMLLQNVNLDIEQGDFILILGGSGAGKTTFLKAILGEIRAHGRILLEGMDLYDNFKFIKHKIGIVPQFSTTRDNDTVYHTIFDAASYKLAGEYSKEEINQRVEYIVGKMMLTNLLDMQIKNLSGGQKKRVEVAIQAIGDQEVFILDEPDSGMDFASRMDLMNNLKMCTDTGEVVAVISHSPDDATALYTKVIVLAKSQQDNVGRLAYYGDVQNALSFFGVEKLSQIVMEINFEGGKGRADEFIARFESTRRG